MGYTHYWKGRVPAATDELLAVIDFIQTTVQMQPLGIKLAGWNGKGSPLFNDVEVEFNGDEAADGGDYSHETFHAEYGTRIQFNCCKTAQKPYDIAVVAILSAFSAYGPEFSWSSDGDEDDVEAGRELARQAIFSLR